MNTITARTTTTSCAPPRVVSWCDVTAPARVKLGLRRGCAFPCVPENTKRHTKRALAQARRHSPAAVGRSCRYAFSESRRRRENNALGRGLPNVPCPFLALGEGRVYQGADRTFTAVRGPKSGAGSRAASASRSQPDSGLSRRETDAEPGSRSVTRRRSPAPARVPPRPLHHRVSKLTRCPGARAVAPTGRRLRCGRATGRARGGAPRRPC